MKSITTILLNNVSYISIALIVAMIVIFAIGVTCCIMLKKTYEKMIKEMDAINNDGMEVYSNKMLNEIVSAFKETYIKSNDEVNTQAIIESAFYKIDKTKIREEAFLKNVNTLLITLGVVGTLYNVIIIVTQLTSMFKGIDVDVTSIQSVFGNVSTILGFVAMAFITTFVAILLSFIYSVVDSIFHVELERKNLFARLEDYLDNSLAANLSKQYPKTVNGLALDNYSNPNTLYKLENTQNQMVAMTAKLEQTITALNDKIKGVIADETKQIETKEEPKQSAPLVFADSDKNESLDEIFSDDMESSSNSIFENQRQARLKLLEETKRLQEQKENEIINSISNGDVIPNANTEYVDEAVIEAPKAEEFLKKEEVFSSPSSVFAPVENEFERPAEDAHHEMESVSAGAFSNGITTDMEQKVQSLVQNLIKEQVTANVPEPVVQPQPLPSASAVMNVPSGAFQQETQVQTQSEMTVIPAVPTLQTSALGVESDEAQTVTEQPGPLKEVEPVPVIETPAPSTPEPAAQNTLFNSVAEEIKNRPDGVKTMTLEDLDRLKQELIRKQQESEAIKKQLEEQNQAK